ncbi:MAG TPA: NADPH:quinone oxidoreductase family protein [Jatrophihabitans sp.]
MRSLLCDSYGSPAVLRLAETAEPQPAPDQVIVAIEAAGINFADGLMVAGTYQTKPPFPFTPGSEVAGVITAVGAEVHGLAVGQRVNSVCGMGGYAEQVAVAASRVSPIPEAMDFPAAAALPVTYGTAYHGLVDKARLATGETVLVLGAAGGVGLACVEVAAALGARVLAAASTTPKRELCLRHGAQRTVGYDEDEFTTALTEFTGGTGIDVVFDPVGGSVGEAALRQLAWGGRFLTIGYASGTIPAVKLNRLLLRESAAIGVLWGAWATRNPEANLANASRLSELWQAEAIRPHVGGTWPLEQAAEALKQVMEGRILGKAVLLPR